MDNKRWQKIDQIFSAAVGLRDGERYDYLRHACDDDNVLFLEITALLKEHESPSVSLDTPVFDLGLQILDGKSVKKRAGETLGHFMIEKLIGRGGMGDIYAAEDKKLGRKVAIKLINETFALDSERIRRFRKEASAVSRVSHANVAELYELCDINGEKLIVMELVEGVSLRQYLADPISSAKALDIGIQVASALAAAHSVGVVHRDIKPENIMIMPNGTVKVLDFGLAKVVDPIGDGVIRRGGGAKPTANMSTELGTLIGTPAYMSPEQIRGTGVDTQTDIWSLGVLLYEMLSGQMPFRGSTKIDVIAGILISEPTLMLHSNVPYPDKLNTIFTRALCKEKTGRYEKIDEMLQDLTRMREMIEITSKATSKTPSRNFLHLIFKHRRKAFATLILAIGIAVLLISASLRRTKSLPPLRASGTSDDAVRDFAISLNPSGNWSYGYKPSDSTLFSLFTTAYKHNYFQLDPGIPIDIWATAGATQPSIMHNISDIDIAPEGVFVLPPDLLNLHPGPNGERSIVRWIAPASTMYQFQCHFQGLDKNGTSTDVAVIYNSVTSLFNENLNGFGDSKSSILTKSLAAGDTMDFSVGDGGNGDFSDSTGLSVSVVNISLPVNSITNGLVSYWPADGNANDVVGGNNGELLHGATYGPGVSGQAFNFGQIDDVMTAPTNSLPTGSSDRTIAMWVKVDDFLLYLHDLTSSVSFFGGYGTFGEYARSYYLGANGQYLFITNWGEGRGYSHLESGKWYHLAATTESNSTSLYLDGILVKTQNLELNTPIDTKFYCGRIPGQLGDARRMKGAVDEIAVYDRALSAAEIQSLFSAVTPPAK